MSGRVRPTKKAKVEASDTKPTLKCRANDHTFIKCFRSSKDLSGRDELTEYHPKFTNQIFEKEEIWGYENLRVDIFYTGNSVKYYMKVSFSKKEKNATDIESALMPHIGSGLCKSESEFLKLADEKYNPPMKKVVKEYGRYKIYRGTVADMQSGGGEAMQSFHKRIQFHTLVNIDGASYIDTTDPKWEIYTIFETAEEGTNSIFIGYATLYPFLGLKNASLKDGFMERIRISQVLIMPQHQGRGHGSKLLEALYDECNKRLCKEITVEDPSEGFRVLRDSLDLQNCLAKGLLKDTVETGKPMPASLQRSIQDKLHITKGQAIRCYEMNMLRVIEADNEVRRKQLRLLVKRRLYYLFQDVISTFSPEDKKVKLAELYDDLEQEYLTVLRRVSKKGIKCNCL